MIRIYTDETILELHKRDMNALREKLREYTPQMVKQQLGMRPKRYQLFMRGELDNQLKAWQLKKIYLFLENGSSLKKDAKSQNTFRLMGDPNLLPKIE